MNHGFKVIPIRMCKNAKAFSKAWEKRAVAINKNMLLGHRSHRAGRFCH